MTAAACVRTQRGKLHVARRVGRVWVAACYREIRGRDLVVYEGRDRLGRRRAGVAWRHEAVCADCAALLARGPRAFQRATGW